MRSSPNNPPGVFFTDLDGTLLASDRTLPTQNLRALHDLGRAGVVRVVATGRSLHSFRHAVPKDLPVDYVIFSTGAGVLSWSENRILIKHELTPEQLRQGRRVLEEEEIDHMIHAPIPDNHRFWYRGDGHGNPDYLARLELLHEFGTKLRQGMEVPGASQLLGIIPRTNGSNQHRCHVHLQKRMPDLNVIRATSPLDHASAWLEIFPATVSKSLAATWLMDHLALTGNPSTAVGNDYNDQDLLEWADNGFVTANAPATLTRRFQKVSTNDAGGVAEAIRKWTQVLL